MTDKNESENSTGDDNPYVVAIMKAHEELQDLRKREHDLTVRKAQLKQTMDALWPLAFPGFDPTPDITSMTLADAIRLVVKSYGRPITVKETRSKLEDLGVDLSKYENPLASIHTAVARMVESEELVWIDDEGKKKKLSPGPELKSVATPEVEYSAVLGILGANAAGEK